MKLNCSCVSPLIVGFLFIPVHAAFSTAGGLSLPRNRSVPENLSEVGKVKEEKSTSSSPKKGLSPATSKSSLGAKLPLLFHRTVSPSTVPRTHERERSGIQ